MIINGEGKKVELLAQLKYNNALIKYGAVIGEDKKLIDHMISINL